MDAPPPPLPGRGIFLDRLGQHLDLLERAELPTSVAVLRLHPIDGVDRDGWALVVRECARRLAATSRAGDTVAHLGGPLLGLLLPMVGLDTGLEVAERARARLARPVELSGDSVLPKVSAAVATARTPVAPSDLLERAEIASERPSGRVVAAYVPADREGVEGAALAALRDRDHATGLLGARAFRTEVDRQRLAGEGGFAVFGLARPDDQSTPSRVGVAGRAIAEALAGRGGLVFSIGLTELALLVPQVADPAEARALPDLVAGAVRQRGLAISGGLVLTLRRELAVLVRADEALQRSRAAGGDRVELVVDP